MTGAIYFIWASSVFPYEWIGYFVAIAGCISCFIIPESPKYLIGVGRFEDASQSLNKIRKFNRVQALIDAEKLSEEFSKLNKGRSEAPSIIYYLKDKTVLVNLVIMMVVWFASVFGYYLINFQLKYLPGNIHINSILSYVADITSYAISGFML